jgi:methionyl-tRNA synthetase
VYVWVDALTNYMSALGYGADGEPPALRYWPAQVHLVGKDIVRFHAVYWPAFLMSAGEPLPESVFAHGWWLRDDAKMSKSLGNVVKPEPLLRDFGADALRYFLLRELTFGLDGTYSDEQMLERYNGDLANDLGNATSRVLALLVSGCGGVLPARTGAPEESELEPAARTAFQGWRAAFDAYDFSGGLSAAWGLLAEVNRFLVRHAPWERKGERQAAVLRGAAEALLQVACMAEPVMPTASREIASRLGATIPDARDTFSWGRLPEGAAVRKASPLFPRVDRAAYFKDLKEGPAVSETKAQDDAGLLTIDDFLKVDLRVAKVTAAERIPGADKLLKLQLDLGSETRQIVAGIARAYDPEQLVGKSIVVVANLRPARLRGVESQGMLLAADLDGRPIVATFEEAVRPGTRVR